jgi:hypothetical protein
MHLDKASARRRWAEARDLLNEWDPIGVISLGFPPDEYECIVGPLLRLTESNATPHDIAAYLEGEASGHFGTTFSGALEFARKFKGWFDANWAGTAV